MRLLFTHLPVRSVLGSLARRCPAKLAEHVSDGPRRTLPTRSTFWRMFLHSARITIQGNPIEGGSKWARFRGTDRATTDVIGASVRSDLTTTREKGRDDHEADDQHERLRRRRDAGARRAGGGPQRRG